MRPITTNRIPAKLALVLTYVLGIAQLCFGQNSVYFDHINTNEGLSQNDINTIYQDRKGFLWFGTHDGLNKYDGYSFTIYQPNGNDPKSISSNLIYEIVGDGSGNLWIGTTGNGLNYFDRGTQTFTQYINDKNNKTSLSNDIVTSMLLDSKNRLWVGTDSGINLLDLEKSKDSVAFQRFYVQQSSNLSSSNENTIYSIYEDDTGQIWLGGAQGLYRATRDNKGDYFIQSMNEAIGLPKNTVGCIGKDRFGRLILGTGNGVYIQGTSTDPIKVRRFHDGFFNSILIDQQNHIWFGTNDGLLYFKNEEGTKFPKLVDHFRYDPRNRHSLSKNIVKSLFIDKTGIIWIGTNGGGINSYDPQRKQFAHIRKSQDPNSLSYDKIRAIFEDSNGTLWFGTEGGGLNMLREEDNDGMYDKFIVLDRIKKPFALSELQQNGKKMLFIGAENVPGLYRLNISSSDTIKEENIEALDEIDRSVFSLLTDSQQRLWIGTYGDGVHRWIPNNGSDGFSKDVFTHHPSGQGTISNNIIRNIYEDSQGNIWFGTAKGLSKLPSEETGNKRPKFSIYQNKIGDQNAISHNYILAIHESSKGDLWIGTFGGGLNKLVPSQSGGDDTFISYSDVDGLPNNVIKGILEDGKGRLWLSTNNGLSRFDPETESFKNYDKNDGLQDNEFQELACLKREDGELLFGGVNGFNAFYPKDISENTVPAETVITNFLISNKPVAIGEEINGRVVLEKNIDDTEEIELKYSENNFSFEFSALHYAAPGKNQFAYMLEGFDKDWITTSPEKRFATYTNLEPDTYTLKVKASNNDDLWDSTPVAMNVTVIHPWWCTTLAKSIYSLMLLGLLWLFWRYTFISTTKKHQLELEHLEKEKSEELHQAKLEFFTNISHELRTPLTLIKGPLEYLKKRGQKLEWSKVRGQYSLMEKNTDYLMRLVDQLLDFRKISQGKMRLVVRNSDIVEFITEVAEPFQFLAHKKSLNFEILAQKRSIKAWFDHDALEKIMNNLLSNAFKFTPENGNITVEISNEKKSDVLQNSKAPSGTSECVLIKVKDTGPGISKNKTSQIFERYYKDGNKGNPKGVGIGLSFTKSLIELHQGAIDINSEENMGTLFEIRLPKQKEAYSKKDDISIKESSDNDYLIRSSETDSLAIDLNDDIIDEGISKPRSKLPTLLVVDDNSDIRTFIKEVLDEEYTIYEAENGKEGLDVALKIIPNIIISDILMPVMDGIEFSRRIKNHGTTSHIPIILLTAKASQESELEGLQIGADDYLRKPFDMELLQLKLSNIINYRKQLRERFNKEIILQPKEVTVTSADERFLQAAMDIVEKHMMNTDFNVEMLVKEMGHSRSNLYIKFKELTGLSSSKFIRSIRLKRAVQLLEQSDLSVKEIMYMTGFNTASYFSKCFKKQFGIIPSEYVRKKQDRV